MDKNKPSETDICDKFITPALQRAGWDIVEQIYREHTLEAGCIVVRGKTACRDQKTVRRADCVLAYSGNLIAVIRVKSGRKETHRVSRRPLCTCWSSSSDTKPMRVG